MSWFDNQNNVIILILIAVILYFMMQKDKFSTINRAVIRYCDGNSNCRRDEYCNRGRCALRRRY